MAGAELPRAEWQNVPAADVVRIRRLTEPLARQSAQQHHAADPMRDGPTGYSTERGLLGEYFGDTDLSDWYFDRVDPEVNFDGRGDGAAQLQLPGVPSAFSIRWTGFLVPPVTGEYRFWVSSDDGARVWLGDNVIVDAWGVRIVRDAFAVVRLVGGEPVPLRIEYMDIGGGQFFKLEWAATAQQKASDSLEAGSAGPLPMAGPSGFARRTLTGEFLRPPDRVHDRTWPGDERRGGWKASYFLRGGFEDLFGTATTSSSVMEWGSGPPLPGMRTAGGPWSAVFEGRIHPPVAGRYGLRVEADDRLRLRLDGQVVIDTFTTRRFVEEREVELASGRGVSLRAEYENEMGDAYLRLRWRLPGTSEWRAVPTSAMGLPDGPDVPPLIWIDRRTVPARFFLGEAGTRAIEARVWTADGVARQAEWLVGAAVLPVEGEVSSGRLKLSWARLPLGQQLVQLRLIDGAGRQAVSPSVAVEAEGVEGGVLEGPWRDARIGGAGRRADVLPDADGWVRVRGTPGDVELQADTLRFVCRPLASGESLETTLRAVESETGAYAAGGLMLRESFEPHAAFVAVLLDTDGRLRVVERMWAGQPTRSFELTRRAGASAGYRVRWAREADTVRLLAWEPRAAAEGPAGGRWRAVWRSGRRWEQEAWCGLLAVSRAGHPILQAARPVHAAVDEPVSRGRGILLTSGSFLAGEASFERTAAGTARIRLRRPDGEQVIQASDVAMISFAEVAAAVWANVEERAPAVLLGSDDVLDGELVRLEEGVGEIETVLFGTRRLNFHTGQALAVALRGLRPAPEPQASLTLADGSVLRGTRLQVGPEGLRVAGGKFESTLPPVQLHELSDR